MGTPTSLAAAVQTVERLLAERFATGVNVTRVDDFPYSRVSRYVLGATDHDVPQTVVVRRLRDDPARSGAARLDNERAALEFLTTIGSTLVPRFIGGGATTGLLITEDLGAHPSLLDLLLGNDEDAARLGLIGFAQALGTLHAQTAGRAPAHDRCRARVGPPDPAPQGLAAPGHIAASWQLVRDAVAHLGLPDPGGATQDVEQVADIIATPGDYLALSSGDPSPINCKVLAGRAVRFFDFEDAGFRHALVDATVLRYPYPTGGPVWRLPDEVTAAAEHAYREALAPAVATAFDDVGYEREMTAACAAWTTLRIARLPSVDAGPDGEPWPLVPPGWTAPLPIRSRRRQLVAIVETFIVTSRRAGALPALASWCEQLAAALRTRWPEATAEIPLYPAFTRYGYDVPC